MTLYRITSDIFGSNENDFVAAEDIYDAIDTYVKKYKDDRNMKRSNITTIERITEDCLISGK